jgi:hypothetical protein
MDEVEFMRVVPFIFDIINFKEAVTRYARSG